jgi:hypothetical protein
VRGELEVRDVVRGERRIQHRTAPGRADAESGERGGDQERGAPAALPDERGDERAGRGRRDGDLRDGMCRRGQLAGDERRRHDG